MKFYKWNECHVPIVEKFRDMFNEEDYSSLIIWEIEGDDVHYKDKPLSCSLGQQNKIIVDINVCQDHNLTEDECIACIAHEIGHIFDSPQNDEAHHEERELNADKKVIELGLQEHLISALKTLCADDTPEQKLLTNKRIKALEESFNR